MSKTVEELKKAVDVAQDAIRGKEGADRMRALLTYNEAKHAHRLEVIKQENGYIDPSYKR
jgi:hypothetical protein